MNRLLSTSPLRFSRSAFTPSSLFTITNTTTYTHSVSKLPPFCQLSRQIHTSSITPRRSLLSTPLLKSHTSNNSLYTFSQRYCTTSFCQKLLQLTTMTPKPSLVTKSIRQAHSSCRTSSSILTTTKRNISELTQSVGKPIPIPGASAPVSPFRKLRRFVFKLILFSAIVLGGGLYWSLYLIDHLEKVMNFNIRFRGQSDIHYYATANRVNHRYVPQYTGDKVSDIKLLQAKIIRDIYKIYLASDPLEKNVDLVNRFLNDQKVRTLHAMAATNPELAAELTEEVLLEAQYSVMLNPSIIDRMLLNNFRVYLTVCFISPNHRQSVEQLHRDFEKLRVFEEDIQGTVDYIDVCLDAIVKGTTSSPFKDPKKLDIYQPNSVLHKPTY